MKKAKTHIVVIGGGLSGAAAAHELTRLGHEVTIIEKRDRLGGRIHSHLVDSAAVEMGAGFLTKDYKNLMDFLDRSGLDRDLYRQKSRTGIYKDGTVRMLSLNNVLTGKLLPLRSLLCIFPLLTRTFIHSRKLSLHKFWKASELDDRPVSKMFKSTGGKEFMETALQPVLNGYFYWNPEHTSAAMMLILCKTVFSHGTYLLAGGLQRIPEAAANGSKVLLSHSVQGVNKAPDGSYILEVECNSKLTTLSAGAIVCATTASEVLDIFPDLSKRQKEFFGAIKYSSAALLASTYDRKSVQSNKSIAFPRNQGIDLSAVTLSDEPGGGAKKYSTVKVYSSGTVAAKMVGLSDQELTSRLNSDLSSVKDDVLTSGTSPITTHVQRWHEALPYFDVGHFKRIANFHAGHVEDPKEHITFAGDYIGGPFMEGAFTSGLQAARRLHDRL